MSVTNKEQTETSTARCTDQYGRTARWYDLLYRAKAPDDLGFYLERARQADGDVLELGCGTGRITLPLAGAGHSVTGLELSRAMLDQFEAKLAGVEDAVRGRISLAAGSMADFELGRKFALVIIPFRAFQHLLTVEEQKSCLACIRRHLAPGGRFVFNAFEPNIGYMLKMGGLEDWTGDADEADEAGAVRVRRSFKVRHNLSTQVIDIDWRIEVLDLLGTLQQTLFEQMQLRWIYRYEARHLLELCGLRIVEALADYDGTALGRAQRELIFVCEAQDHN